MYLQPSQNHFLNSLTNTSKKTKDKYDVTAPNTPRETYIGLTEHELKTRINEHKARMNQWLDAQDLQKMVIVEIGAGTGFPSVRRKSHFLLSKGATLIRINTREAHGNRI